jgi:DNA gyrase subunit A
VKGPDFPTGGQILNSRKELREIYEAGQGPIKLRGEHKIEEGKRGQRFIVITSVPYALNKSALVEDIANVIRDRKLPHLVDVRDESTDDVRVVLEIKKDADPALVMAYLYKNTALQQNFNVNLTCLVPQEGSEVGVAKRVDLKTALQVFLDFRFQVVTRRFQHRLAELKARIHLLEGFAKIFDALDETIKIIRKADGKADAAAKLMKRFELDEIQVEAILEMKLYKLARLEIEEIREELATKQKEAKKIEAILKDPKKVWAHVREEILAIKEAFPDKRRTEVKVAGVEDAQEFSEEQFIIAEDANVVLTRDGWIKRVRELKDPTATRVRDGDAVAWVLAASTRENVIFFSNFGTAYVIRVNDVPPSTGYGDPVQRLFKFKDNEKLVAAFSLDPRLPRPTNYVAVTKDGLGLRFASEGHLETSTRAGRKFAKTGDGDEIVAVLPAEEKDVVCVATEKAHVLLCSAAEVNVLANPGKGVTVINVDESDKVIGVGIARGPQEIPLVVETAGGKQFEIGPSTYKPTARGGKGRQIITRTTIHAVPAAVKVTSFTPTEVN